MFSRIRKTLNTKKIINVLIFSYAVMLLLPFIAGMISFGVGNNIIKNYVSNTAISYARNFADKFDRVILDYSHTQNQIYFDEQIKDLCDSLNRTDDVLAMRTLSSKLKSLIYSNSNISDIVVFPFDSNYVIHSSGFFDKKQYYDAYLNPKTIDEKDFREIINDKGGSYFCLFPDSDTFTYSVNLTVASGASHARIFIMSDCNKIFRTVLPETDAFFVFQNETLLVSSDESKSESNLSLIEFMSENGISKHVENNIFATTIESDVSNLTYFYITDLQPISASQKTYIIISSTIFIITLLISIILFKLFIEIQYKPINNIIKYIKSQTNTNNDVYSFEFINNNINNLEKEILRQKESYFDQNNLLLSMHLSQWLKYNKIPTHPEEIIKIKKDCFYIVVSVTFELPEALFFEHNPQGVEQNISIAKFIIENILSEMLDNISVSNKMIEFEDSVAAIVLFDKNSHYKTILQDTFNYITETVQKEFNLEPSYHCSSPYNTYEMLSRAYSETLALIHNKNQLKNICVFYEDAKFGSETIISRLSKNLKLLFNYISIGNAKNAEMTIKTICASADNDLSVTNTRYVLACLLSSINDAFSEVSSLNDTDNHKFIEQNAPIDLIMTADNIKDPQQALIRYSNNVCACINKDEQEPASISQKAKVYIGEHYSDSQLTSDLVANSVGLSRDYFLKLFKHQTGESMLDYLNKIRIERACEIIKSEKCSLSDVAGRVGYTNVKTFTRAFIKHVGITPGKYKSV